MPQINTSDSQQKWRFTCPSPARHHDWRVVDGLFECRSCNETYRELADRKTGERIARENFEFVGPDADSKGQFGQPTVGGE